MVYLVFEIIIFLVLALLLGTALGYLLSRSMVSDVRTSVEQLKLDVAANRKRLSATETDLQLHKSSLNELRAAYDGLQERLSVHSDRQADLSGQMEGLVAARSALSERTATLASQLTEAQAGLGRQLEATQISLSGRIDGLSANRDGHAQRLIALEGVSDHLATEHRAILQRFENLSTLASPSAANNEVAGDQAARARADHDRLLSITDRLHGVEERVGAVSNDVESVQKQLASLAAKHDDADAELDNVRNQLEVLSESEGEMSAQLESLSEIPAQVTGLDEIHQDLEARMRAVEALPMQMESTRGQVERMASTAAALTSRLEHQDRWGQETDERINALEQRVANDTSLPGRTTSVPVASVAPSASVASRPSPVSMDSNPVMPVDPSLPSDNLKQIRGVGVALERTLNEAGIRRFEQIAAWQRDDIESLSGVLEKFQGRIIRDDWVAQAKALIDDRDSGGGAKSARNRAPAKPKPAPNVEWS